MDDRMKLSEIGMDVISIRPVRTEVCLVFVKGVKVGVSVKDFVGSPMRLTGTNYGDWRLICNRNFG